VTASSADAEAMVPVDFDGELWISIQSQYLLDFIGVCASDAVPFP
jgi:hypothetical protein